MGERTSRNMDPETENILGELLDSKELYQVLYENIIDGVVHIDMHGTVIMCNERILEMFGYPREEIIGAQFTEFLHPDYRDSSWSEYLSATKRGHADVSGMEYIGLRKDGTTFHFHENSSVILWKGEVIAVQSHIRDISNRIDAESRLKASNAELELYTSLLRHDFSNDIQVVRSALEMLLTSVQDDNLREYCDIINGASTRMASLITLVDSSSDKLSETLVELIEVQATQARITHPNLTIIVKADETTRRIALNSGRLLLPFFDNIFRNCAMYAGESPELEIDVTNKENHVQIDITDDGPGLPPEIKERLFERGISTSGGGVGLYLCRKVIEGYNGTLELVDGGSRSSGTTFRVILPIQYI